MALNKILVVVLILSSFVVKFAPDATAAEPGRGKNDCRRGERIRIQDLDMSPDPIFEGRFVRAWKLRLNFEGRRDCDTDILIRDGSNVIGKVRHFRLCP